MVWSLPFPPAWITWCATWVSDVPSPAERLNISGKVFVQMFDVALANWYGEPSGLCVFQETCGLALALEHNGDLYACDHYVEPDYCLGNILETPMIELVALDRQRWFGQQKRDTLPQYGRECDVRFACHGECPRNRIVKTPDGEPGLNYLCAGLKLFFHHVDRPMRIMVDLLRQNRAPAEIMRWYKAQDLGLSEQPAASEEQRSARMNLAIRSGRHKGKPIPDR
jgi:uncharacterized protein